MTTTLVLSTLMSKQPPVCEGGRFGGRQSGRKCGDVDDYLSDHGKTEVLQLLSAIHVNIGKAFT